MRTVGFGTGRLPDRESYDAIRTAIEVGYRFFDMARVYGTEEVLAEVLTDTDISRSELFIGTKVESKQLQFEDVLIEVEKSLDALSTDYLDVVYVHWPAHEYEPKRTFSAFHKLKSENTIRSIGICNVTAPLLEETIRLSPATIDFAQIEFHPYLYQPDVLEIANQNDIEVVAESPLANGRVLDDDVINRMAERKNVSPSQVVLAWILAHGAIPIPRSSTPEHIRENFRASKVSIAPTEREILNGLDVGYRINDYPFAPWNE